MNLVKTKFESNLRLENLYFKNISFIRPSVVPEDISLKIKVSTNTTCLNSEDNQYQVELSVQVSDDNEVFKVLVDLVGVFQLSEINMDEKFKKGIVEKNTLSIMFPYVRSQISLLTTQPGLTPLIIPAFNINKLIESQREEEVK